MNIERIFSLSKEKFIFTYLVSPPAFKEFFFFFCNSNSGFSSWNSTKFYKALFLITIKFKEIVRPWSFYYYIFYTFAYLNTGYIEKANESELNCFFLQLIQDTLKLFINLYHKHVHITYQNRNYHQFCSEVRNKICSYLHFLYNLDIPRTLSQDIIKMMFLCSENLV